MTRGAIEGESSSNTHTIFEIQGLNPLGAETQSAVHGYEKDGSESQNTYDDNYHGQKTTLPYRA